MALFSLKLGSTLHDDFLWLYGIYKLPVVAGVGRQAMVNDE